MNGCKSFDLEASKLRLNCIGVTTNQFLQYSHVSPIIIDLESKCEKLCTHIIYIEILGLIIKFHSSHAPYIKLKRRLPVPCIQKVFHFPYQE